MREFFLIMPEIFLALTLAFVIVSEITYYGEQMRLVKLMSLIGLGGALVQTIITYEYGASRIFGGVLSIDGFSLFFKLLFITLAALSIVSIKHTKEIAHPRRTEFCTLILAATLSMCLMASAADMTLIFLSLLFLNVMTFFLSAYAHRSILSTEASVKSLAFGAVTTVFILYAMAILFGFTHTLNIYEIHHSLVTTPLPSKMMLIVFLLSFLAFGFHLGAFPMYVLMPDLLEGAPTPVSGFLSVGMRAAGFAVATRFLVVVFAQPGLSKGQWQILGSVDWTEILAVLAGLTMLIGSLLAFRQKGAKRLVAYLVVAQTGFLLTGLLVLDEVGIAAVLYNLVVELFALMGSFYILSFLFDELRSDRLEDLRGMMRRAVPECICLILFLLCLVGSPPMPGFIGKFTLIGVAIRHQRVVLALVAVLSMVISTAAVARLIYHLVGNFQEATELPMGSNLARSSYLVVLMVPLVLTGVFAEFVFNWAGQSLGFIFW